MRASARFLPSSSREMCFAERFDSGCGDEYQFLDIVARRIKEAYPASERMAEQNGPDDAKLAHKGLEHGSIIFHAPNRRRLGRSSETGKIDIIDSVLLGSNPRY